MAFVCLVDKTEFDDLDALHYHLKELKVSQKTYYLQYCNKKDLLTGETLEFKSVEQYLSNDFQDKNNLKKYLKTNVEEGKKWSLNWLKLRKESKNLRWAPSQVELRSLPCPTIPYFDFIGGYNKICTEMGMQLKYTNEDLVFKKLPVEAKIIVDSREQKPLSFNNSVIEAVNVGDYALTKPYDKKIYVERKSLLDFIGTLTKDLGRFEREIERAVKDKSYIVMLVENDINDCLGFTFLAKKYIGLRYVKTTPAHVFKNLRDLLQKYDNFQVLFVNGRIEAKNGVIKIFELGEQVKKTDLQLFYELKKLVLL
ncbi:MAG: ERCC4 domain-containing protein [bacterium]|mgnify:CR=1 FL=1|nr:ERCC4 domain-containing protein [bacterium]